MQTARTVSSCADCTRNKIFGQTTWHRRGSSRVKTARARCRVQTARARCLVQTAHGTRFLGRLRGSYVAAFVCRLHARGVLCRLHTEQDFGQTTWHRRGNCRSQNVVQLQASTRLKTVCTPSYSREVTIYTPCKLHKILLPGGYFPIPRRGSW